MPITGTVRFSDRKRVTRDLVAGTTVAALLVPQAMAYAELAGLPAVTGLYASLVPLVIYAFVGTSRQMAIGPTATVAVLSATIIGPLAKGNETQALALSATLALLVGAICMLGGVLRAGFVVNFLSQPVLSGYVTGAALVIAASQLGKVLGYSVSGDTFFQIVRDALRNINQTNLWTLGVACASVAVMVALQRLTPKLPAALIVVILAIVVTTVFDLAAEGVKITGVVPGGLPSFKFPNVGLNDIGRLLTDAAGGLPWSLMSNPLPYRRRSPLAGGTPSTRTVN
jgi:SulP family sulfate permease